MQEHIARMKDNIPEAIESVPVRSEDLARLLTFSTFWGSVSYLLATVSLAASHKCQPVATDVPTLAAGMGIHVGSFVTLGALGGVIASAVRGRRISDEAQERISDGEIERSIGQQALGSAAGSLAPLTLALLSMAAAERITGRYAFSRGGDINWGKAGLIMSAASGLTALAVSRITGWVASDAREG